MRACRGDLDRAERDLRRLILRVERLLRRHWEKVEALAKELLEAGALTYRD